MEIMRRLAATADVFASTYRPAVNERFGLLPDQLAAASERGIVYMSANAYGHSGPWKERPGFDQNGQVASGFAMAEGRGSPPKFSPVFYLADLMTGHFAAAGMMAALHRRALEGGSYQVKLSLTAAPCGSRNWACSTSTPRVRCPKPIHTGPTRSRSTRRTAP
jgi:crotonobetainyl-CoA:carnitine CoA-transferase CaiB-like acyl-CoA transferase